MSLRARVEPTPSGPEVVYAAREDGEMVLEVGNAGTVTIREIPREGSGPSFTHCAWGAGSWRSARITGTYDTP